MVRASRVLVAFVLSAATACQPRSPVVGSPPSIEAEVRARSRALVEAEQRQDLAAIMTFYAENAVAHVENAPAAQGHAQIRALYGSFFQMPITAFEPTIGRLEVAQSGDLAYETGTNLFTLDQGGRSVTLRGKYLAVWRRDGTGAWRIAALAVTNDHAMPQ